MDASTATRRRAHRKSRLGCKQCKERHAKCDETRPSCVNCSTVSRRCSYLDQIAASRPPSLSSRAAPPATSPPTTSTINIDGFPGGATSSLQSEGEDGAAVGAVTASPSRISESPANGHREALFDVRHLILLHHFDTVIVSMSHIGLPIGESAAKQFFDLFFRSAVSQPFLLDELLAFSAAHLSTVQTNAVDKTRYADLAAELQTRALARFNAKAVEVRDDNCVAIFFFCSLIGMHTLFDALRDPGDFGEFLDSFIQYLHIHRGVRTVAGQSWHIISRTEMAYILDAMQTMKQQKATFPLGNECESLVSLLAASRDTLGPENFSACLAAVTALRQLFTQHLVVPKPASPHILLHWPIVIPDGFVTLLAQRRPEALVILANWGMLLHRERDFWVYGDAGRYIIDSVARYLGSYWDQWTAIPRGVPASQ